MDRLEHLDEELQFLEQFKLKRLIKKLQLSDGNGTSLISLIIPAGKQLHDYLQMLTDEYGKAENIKDRANRQSVQTAIVSAKELLRNYSGKNLTGVCIFTGNVKLPNSNTIKKLKICFEPYRKVSSKLYNCGPKFQTDPLEKLVESNDTFGFVIVDGNGCLMAKLTGNTKTIISKFTVDLPKKHGRGG